MGYGIFGYVEVRDDESKEWSVYTELETGDVPRSSATDFVFGYGVSDGSDASLFKDRGLPLDATDEVREDYLEDQVHDGHRGEFREMFGHSHAYARELPAFVREKFTPLEEAAEEHEHARLLVWFNR